LDADFIPVLVKVDALSLISSLSLTDVVESKELPVVSGATNTISTSESETLIPLADELSGSWQKSYLIKLNVAVDLGSVLSVFYDHNGLT
jgi:hypothetical protein